MFRILNNSSKRILGWSLALSALMPVGGAWAKSGETVLYSFGAESNDGRNPPAALIIDTKGNLYGTAVDGGQYGSGAVFKLAPNGTETVLYSFGSSDGDQPNGGVLMDTKGNLYGPTVVGGADGQGAVFELASDGTETVLFSFTGGSGGASPWPGLIMDKTGNLYGTAVSGGTNNNGIVFELASNGTEKALHTFLGGNDGAVPYAKLIADKKGNLYGTTVSGGEYSGGVVYKVTPKGKETVLYSFCAQDHCADGLGPTSGLLVDASGNLYGMTVFGGTPNEGVVFKLAPDGTETVLYTFCTKKNCADGAQPNGGFLIMDKKGNLYGTTQYGGEYSNGTVFTFAPNGTETVLHSFGSGSDGANPTAGLLMNKKGNLYGTTYNGGANGYGTVFEITK